MTPLLPERLQWISLSQSIPAYGGVVFTEFHIVGISLPSESYKTELCLDQPCSYLERIATGRVKGWKLVLLEPSAAQSHPEVQRDVLKRGREHSEEGITGAAFPPRCADAIALTIRNNADSSPCHTALHFRAEEQDLRS